MWCSSLVVKNWVRLIHILSISNTGDCGLPEVANNCTTHGCFRKSKHFLSWFSNILELTCKHIHATILCNFIHLFFTYVNRPSTTTCSNFNINLYLAYLYKPPIHHTKLYHRYKLTVRQYTLLTHKHVLKFANLEGNGQPGK